jgi:hypothetical protein
MQEGSSGASEASEAETLGNHNQFLHLLLQLYSLRCLAASLWSFAHCVADW